MSRESFQQTIISVKVQPNAGNNGIVSLSSGIWRIKIAAPPDKGKANKELIAFLSTLLGISKSSITIIRGQTSHHKVLAIAGIGENALQSKLKPD